MVTDCSKSDGWSLVKRLPAERHRFLVINFGSGSFGLELERCFFGSFQIVDVVLKQKVRKPRTAVDFLFYFMHCYLVITN